LLAIGFDHGKDKQFKIFTGQRLLILEKVTISKLKATCLRLLDNLKKTGHPLLVTRKGEPIALVTPPPTKHRAWLGCLKDTVKITGDIISHALDEKEWEALQD
jgi:antitoxin (DNA-binding transcriptional repressor) of toxin-antitoxin stability system